MAAEQTAQPPPAAVLAQMAQGFMVAKAVQAAAVLGIADLLADGPRIVADLAATTSTHEPTLGRHRWLLVAVVMVAVLLLRRRRHGPRPGGADSAERG